MAAQPKTLDSSQVYSLAGHQMFCRIVESFCFGNFWAPEILRVFLADGSLSRNIGFRPCPLSRILEGGNPLALHKTGISRNQEWHWRRLNTIRILSNLQLQSAAYW
jgi:hypothetical protein